MKRIYSYSVILIVAAIIATPLLMPRNAVSSSKASSPAGPVIPDSVKVVLEKSCFPCHASPGKGMAMSKLNFDKWADYSPEKQANKAADMCEEMTKSKMPPSSFRKNNPDKVPTAQDISIICNWTKTFVKK
jgi:hypothetical protein